MGSAKKGKGIGKSKSILGLIAGGMDPYIAMMSGKMPPMGEDVSNVLKDVKTDRLRVLINNLEKKLTEVKLRSLIAADVRWRLDTSQTEYTHRISGLDSWIKEIPTPFGGAPEKKIRRTDRSSSMNEFQVMDYGLIEYITNRSIDRQVELIKFVYALDSQGQKPTLEILAGFYQALRDYQLRRKQLSRFYTLNIYSYN